ncbi:MAG: hypothetical protein L6Q53_06080 [Candidatus Brocadia sinica]|nr:hypothetical protein [Candidatus Brocadia sinica]
MDVGFGIFTHLCPSWEGICYILLLGGICNIPLLGGGRGWVILQLVILPDLLHGIQGFHLLVDDVGMEYPEPFCLFFLFQHPAELLFEIEVEEFTGGLVVGAIGDLLVALEFFDRLILI